MFLENIKSSEINRYSFFVPGLFKDSEYSVIFAPKSKQLKCPTYGGNHIFMGKSRISNIELYRIITMWFIIAHHYVVNSGLMTIIEQQPISTPSIFYLILGAWGKTAINSFVLITGYFMCTSKISLHKFIKLYSQIVFYSVIIYTIFCFTGIYKFSLRSFIFKFLPFNKILSDNFECAFIVWWLFIPYLNSIVNNITYKQHFILIVLSVLLFTIYPLLPYFYISVNPICWFSTLFFISSFIRKYPQKIYKNNSTKIWAFFSMTSIVASIFSILLILYINDVRHSNHDLYYFLSDYNKPMALIVSVCSFMLFKNLKMGFHPFINRVAASTFGVLLIHANGSAMRNFLWFELIDCKGHYSVNYYCIYMIMCVSLVYVICTFIDFIRIKFLEDNINNSIEIFLTKTISIFSKKW